MTSELDKYARDLQQRIFNEARKTYGEIVFKRWQNPLYMGVLKDADGHGSVTGTCGDTMEVFLKFKNAKVTRATFLTNGCASSIVCGSFAAELALGKNSDELMDVTGEKILSYVGGLPKEEQHCAFLAAETLQKALDDYMKKQANRMDSKK